MAQVTQAAWKAKPSWYVVATEDRMIPPPAQQFMSKRAGAKVVEVAGDCRPDQNGGCGN